MNETTEIQEQQDGKTMFKKVSDIILYPLRQIIEGTRIRMDAHLYIEIKLPFFYGSLKLCIITLWIILYMVYQKLL